MIDIEDITPGESYACKFRVKTMLDEHDRPAPNLTDTPLKGVGDYESLGVLMQRDTEQRLVKLKDQKSSKEFVVGYNDIWDIDTVDWVEPLVTNG
tara:strand:- start:368 stop:652 length:285 start_codon:yes stop_codon:yes gene_type:complete